MERHFHEELKKLNSDLLKMATMVESAICDAVESLKRRDKKLAQSVIENDSKIDEMEIMIEEAAISLLALNQPMAVDLRFITTGMRINSELERIADLAVNIAQRVLYNLSDGEHIKPLVDIPKISDMARKMVKDAIDAFVGRDEKKAGEVILMDPQADALRDNIYNELVYDYIVKDGRTAPKAVPLLLVSRYLERICDHATYIAEDVIYMVRARVVKHHTDQLMNINDEKKFDSYDR